MRILTICHDHPHITDAGTEHLAHDLSRTLDGLPGVSARFLAASTSLSHPEVPAGADVRLENGHGVGKGELTIDLDRLGDRTVEQVALIWHFGYEGLAKGASANLLTPAVGDADALSLGRIRISGP